MYETDITNQDQSAFRNKASLVSADKVISSAEGTVNVTRGSPLNKKPPTTTQSHKQLRGKFVITITKKRLLKRMLC